MKILRIQFQNLNSLPSGDIDLESAPLAGAGIFAITGPTGAGKSTILDAITLALYGRAARYGTAPNPVDMMSRHTGECQAEVLFEVPRGRFRATWQLWRTRRKPDGNPQPPRRQVSDAEGKVLAQNVTESERLIEELTGLDCGRFLRSVLLAQGEFAQFLKSGKDARAELLESLTGTQIYSDLGTLAYQEFTGREQALLQKEGTLGQIVLLSEEEQADRASRIEAATAALAHWTRERETAAKRIEQGSQLALLLTGESDVCRKQTALLQEKESEAGHFQRLARHRLAQPFFPDLQTLDGLAAQAAREGAQHDDARAAANTARSRLASAIHAATLLAGGELQTARETEARARETAATGHRQLATLDQWVAEHTRDAALETALPGLVERLAGLANERRLHAHAAAQGNTLAQEASAVGKRLALLDTRKTEETARLAEAASQAGQAADALAALLDGRTPAAILASARAFDTKAAALAELRSAMEKRDAAAREALEISNSETALAEELETARAQKLATESEALAQAHVLELTQTNLALLEKIAGYEDQRTQLAPGETCPLCGSREHPFATPGAAPSATLQEAQRNVARAKKANATAIKEAELAIRNLARTGEELRGLQKRRGQLRQLQMSHHEAFERLGKSLHVFTAEALEEALEANTNAKTAHEALLGALREAEAAKNRTEMAHLKQQAEVARLAETATGERNGLARVQQQIAENASALVQSEKTVAAHTEALATALPPFGAALPEPGKEPQTRQALEKRHQEYQKNSRARTGLAAELKQAALRIEALQRQTAECHEAAQKIAALQKAEDLANTPADPALSGQFRQTWANLEEAQTALAALGSQRTQTAATLEERRKSRDAVENAARQHAAQLQTRLAATPETPFAEVAALRAARLPDAEAAKIEQRERDLQGKTQALAGRLTQLREQIRTLREDAQAPEGEALVALETARNDCDVRLTELTEARIALRNEIARDAQNRKAKAEQAQAVEEERQRLRVWGQLRTLIGSHDGAKFRQFAQGLSLDVLLRHANRHLRRLSERYQLRRVAGGELMLEIVDLHQANTTRPMLSLSGGESFLASLALALGLSDLAGRNVRIDSLFIDEGFGSLDAETLDTAVAALDALRLSNKTVGVISHIELLKERIPVQIRVEKVAAGRSILHVPGS